jgi:hypothetical protein
MALGRGAGAGIYRGDGVGGKELSRHQSASTPLTTVGSTDLKPP